MKEPGKNNTVNESKDGFFGAFCHKTMLFFALMFGLAACTELFIPEIQAPGEVLVVEGLLTNQPGSAMVKLTVGVPYEGRFRDKPVQGANVFVAVDDGSSIPFNEAEPGVYRPPAHYAALQGRTYTLHIETNTGEIYRSNPQTLNPAVFADSLAALYTERIMEYQNLTGDREVGPVEGLEFSIELDTGEAYPMLRFETHILVQYVLYLFDPPMPGDLVLMFCRRKIPMDDEVNVMVPDFEFTGGDRLRHTIGFMPRSFRFFEGDPYWGLYRLDRRLVILRQFGLNQESYGFYKGLRELMTSQGRMFDPIPGQISGNIFCVSDPDKPALGLFEVSSMQSATFALSGEPITATRNHIWRIRDLDFLPDHECSYERIPLHWYY